MIFGLRARVSIREAEADAGARAEADAGRALNGSPSLGPLPALAPLALSGDGPQGCGSPPRKGIPMPLPANATPTATISATASLERLDCCRVARDFARLAQLLPIANQVLRDHFWRASLSVLTNIAEGAGRIFRADPA
ncbi:MAG: four helix bundle protein [Deltaproteobacteria bacterium]|nr:four helix bundle protein [Deltaproteobacteria bacterium]